MRAYLLAAGVFVLGAAFGAYLARPEPQEPAWAGGLPVAGDANGDGTLDISDPVYLLVHLFRRGPPPVEPPGSAGPISAFVIVRHGEKEEAGPDPGLTPEGQARAEELARVLEPVPVDVLVASSYRRTRETLAPLAAVKGLPVVEIQAAAGVVEHLESLPAGSVAVVAHHSFTIHDILEGLGIDGTRETITVSGERYDNFLVLLRPARGEPQLLHLLYGAPPP